MELEEHFVLHVGVYVYVSLSVVANPVNNNKRRITTTKPQ